ncbi:MAG: hypothetical protein OXU61_11865 [Gammaproteobacteria bacterium]|nr:hypothetical protein [Gammaproteobacteria bacterium]
MRALPADEPKPEYPIRDGRLSENQKICILARKPLPAALEHLRFGFDAVHRPGGWLEGPVEFSIWQLPATERVDHMLLLAPVFVVREVTDQDGKSLAR